MQAKELDRAYRPWQIRIFIATWLAYAGYYFCRKPFYVVKADMAGALGFSTVQLAHLGTAYLAAYAVGQFSSAYFGRKLGPKLLLLAGMGISIACNFMFGISNGFGTIVLFLALNGLAQGTGWPGCIGSSRVLVPRGSSAAACWGVWSTCYSLDRSWSTGFAAYMLGRAGWRWSYFGASLVLLGSGRWWCSFIRTGRRASGWRHWPRTARKRRAARPKADRATGIRGLGWSRDVVINIAIDGSDLLRIKFLRYALWSWAPFFLRQNFGLAGDIAGYLSTVFEFCGIRGRDRLRLRLRQDLPRPARVALVPMLAMMTLSFVLMATLGATSVTFFTIAMGLAGFMLFGPDRCCRA